MKKIKTNKLNLNKQTIANLGEINGGKTMPPPFTQANLGTLCPSYPSVCVTCATKCIDATCYTYCKLC